jgi:hypothetical protein
MNKQNKPVADSSEVLSANFLRDPYLEWAKAEGVPIVEEFAVNLQTSPLRAGTARACRAPSFISKAAATLCRFLSSICPRAGRRRGSVTFMKK